jgi:hypothetical protein
MWWLQDDADLGSWNKRSVKLARKDIDYRVTVLMGTKSAFLAAGESFSDDHGVLPAGLIEISDEARAVRTR